MGAALGGGAKTVLIPIKTDHSALMTYSAGSTTETVPTTEAGGFVIAKSGNAIQISTDIAIGDDKKCTLTIPTTKWDSAIYAFLKYASPMTAAGATGTDPEEISDEDGNKIGGAGASVSGKQFLLINYGKTNGTETDVFVSIVTATWSGVKRENAKWVQPQLKFTSVECTKTDGLSIPATMFDSAKVTVSTAQTLPINAYGEFLFLTPAA